MNEDRSRDEVKSQPESKSQDSQAPQSDESSGGSGVNEDRSQDKEAVTLGQWIKEQEKNGWEDFKSDATESSSSFSDDNSRSCPN